MEVVMKNALKILALIVVGSLTMSAQLSNGLVAKVPFGFTAGYKSFPAGDYQVFAGPSPGVVWVRSLDGKTGAFVMSQRSESLKTPDKSSLVFNRYGSRYFLSQIWVQGNTSGVLFRPTPAEVKAAKELAANTESVVASTGSKP